MKKLFVFLMLMFIGMIGKAQTVDSAYVDSLYQDIAGSHDSILLEVEDLQDKVYQINLHLEKAHEQYRVGTLLVAAGVLMQGFAVVLDPSSPNGFIAGLGSLSILTGGVFWIDSHKFFHRASGNRYYYFNKYR